jgi:hypothetical protein
VSSQSKASRTCLFSSFRPSSQRGSSSSSFSFLQFILQIFLIQILPNSIVNRRLSKARSKSSAVCLRGPRQLSILIIIHPLHIHSFFPPFSAYSCEGPSPPPSSAPFFPQNWLVFAMCPGLIFGTYKRKWRRRTQFLRGRT